MDIDLKQLEYRIAFSQIKGMNVAIGREILSRIGDEQAFFEATETQIKTLLTSRSNLFSESARQAAFEIGKREATFVISNKIKPLYFKDAAYPQRLLECIDAPLMLYTIGSCDLNAAHIISIVGTRHATPYGVKFVSDLVSDLSRKIDDLVIISGLAYGIDITAHRAAMKAGVRTAAVFGNGLSTIYPAAHRNDAATMAGNGGAVITEYLHDAQIHRANFLARNRIVAGMSDCTVVVESADKGGAMVTARIASEYNRDVFALPGRTSDPYSAGCNTLIATNIASLITSADDLISAMRWTPRPEEGDQSELFLELSSEERQVVDYITAKGEARLNHLSVELNMPMNQLLNTLFELENHNLILPCPGGLYRLA